MRRCLAANTAFVDSLIDAAEDLPEGDLFQLLRAQAASFERLTAAVIDEHARESESHPATAMRYLHPALP